MTFVDATLILLAVVTMLVIFVDDLVEGQFQ